MRTEEEIKIRLEKVQDNAQKWFDSYEKYKSLNDAESMKIAHSYYEIELQEIYALKWVLNKY